MPPEDDAGRSLREAPGRDPVEEIATQVRAISRENERLFRRLLEGERRFRALAKAVWRIQEEERRKLARELHDGIGQTLTALKNHLQLTARRVADGEAVDGRLDQAIELAARALGDTRALSRLLRPPVLDDLGLAAALRWLARTMGEETGFDVEPTIEGDDRRLPAEHETLVFRVVQEALTNVLKHAGVDRACLDVGIHETGLRIVVSDQGRGFDPAQVAGESGFGLRGIQDRVELFGGEVRIDSAPGRGTVIDAFVPLVAASGQGVEESR